MRLALVLFVSFVMAGIQAMPSTIAPPTSTDFSEFPSSTTEAGLLHATDATLTTETGTETTSSLLNADATTSATGTATPTTSTASTVAKSGLLRQQLGISASNHRLTGRVILANTRMEGNEEWGVGAEQAELACDRIARYQPKETHSLLRAFVERFWSPHGDSTSKRMEGHLLSVGSTYEVLALSRLLKPLPAGAYWTGGKLVRYRVSNMHEDVRTNHVFLTWSDGRVGRPGVLGMTPLDQDQLREGYTYCLALNLREASWQARDCSDILPYACLITPRRVSFSNQASATTPQTSTDSTMAETEIGAESTSMTTDAESTSMTTGAESTSMTTGTESTSMTTGAEGTSMMTGTPMTLMATDEGDLATEEEGTGTGTIMTTPVTSDMPEVLAGTELPAEDDTGEENMSTVTGMTTGITESLLNEEIATGTTSITTGITESLLNEEMATGTSSMTTGTTESLLNEEIATGISSLTTGTTESLLNEELATGTTSMPTGTDTMTTPVISGAAGSMDQDEEEEGEIESEENQEETGEEEEGMTTEIGGESTVTPGLLSQGTTVTSVTGTTGTTSSQLLEEQVMTTGGISGTATPMTTGPTTTGMGEMFEVSGTPAPEINEAVDMDDDDDDNDDEDDEDHRRPIETEKIKEVMINIGTSTPMQATTTLSSLTTQSLLHGTGMEVTVTGMTGTTSPTHTTAGVLNAVAGQEATTMTPYTTTIGEDVEE